MTRVRRHTRRSVPGRRGDPARLGGAHPGGLVVALLVVGALLVPWSRPPAPRADQLAALRDLPADQVARGRAFQAALRPGRYTALAVGLVVALLLGLTPLGGRLVELAGPAVRRPLDRPRRCSAGSPWCSSPTCSRCRSPPGGSRC